MWSDNVSEVDMLAYEPYAELIYEIAISDRLNPITIGLFGSWGSGKSTLLDIIQKKIEFNQHTDKNIKAIKVNAWLYEGYDDAKTALMETILRKIKDEITIPEECKNNLLKLIKKVDWLRLGLTIAKKGIPLAVSALSGNPAPAIISALGGLNDIDWANEEKVNELQEKVSKVKEFIKDDENDKENVVENVRTFRTEFENLLGQSNIDNLIIMVDDLDRCSPDRIIDTIEAIKLFLAVNKTTFILAVDDEVLKYSIKRKYPRIDDEKSTDISKDYIEKIVQLPIDLPELSEIDIKNYILLLICEMFLKKESLINLISFLKEKGIFIKGEIISVNDIYSFSEGKEDSILEQPSLKAAFQDYLSLFNKVSDIVSNSLKGNPRQTKRFMNKFFIRKRLAEIQKINLNEAILAKLMVLEYSNKDLFKELYRWQFKNKGFAYELKDIENYVIGNKRDEEFENKNKQWLEPRIKDWIILEPSNLSEIDLRQYFYLAKETVKDEKISMLNLKSEIRQTVSEICNVEFESSIRIKIIETLKNEPANTRNDIYKAIINKYDQDHEGMKYVLLDVIKVLPEYTDKIILELKKLQKKEIDPGFILELKTFKKPQADSIDELIKFFVKHEIISTKSLEKIELIGKGGK